VKIRCLIVDDEPLAIDVLRNYINRLDILMLVDSCRSAQEAFNILQQEKVDVVFLDIQMPKMTGIRLVEHLVHPPQIIFTTAYRDYAVESYELSAVDYLVKPIAFERFLKAVQKVTNRGEQPLLSSYSANAEEIVCLKAESKTFRIPLHDINYLESFKDYVIVHTNTEKLTTYQSISHWERDLPTDKFVRIHRSFLVATDKIRAYSAAAVQIGTTDLPIGRTYKEAVMKVLG
jgi:DNA-binding LytR/AlgR family response regulator